MITKEKTNVLNLIRSAKYGLVILALAAMIYTLVRTPAEGVAIAVETQGGDFGISTYPASGLLKAPNMYPGKRVTADLTVKNEGQLDFTYDISAVKNSGHDLLFNGLKLEIRNGEGLVLFSGNISSLQNTAVGVLGKGGTDILTFTVELPANTGDEFQGKVLDLTFLLKATEHPPYIGGGDIIWEPPLEKADVNVRKGEILPVRFHLIKDGTYDLVKRGIDLIITGVNSAGQPVEYTFSTVNGTLGWDGSLQKPHYELMFDAGKYPVNPDTYYTATVKCSDQTLGSTVFKSGH